MSEPDNTLARWRLILGKYAEKGLPHTIQSAHAARLDAALEFLYSREYLGRGVRGEHGAASLEASQPSLVTWLGEVRELFPNDAVEVIEKHALERYGLTELLTDPRTLERLEPNQQLLHTLLTLRGYLKDEVLQVARRIIRQVIEEIRARLESEVRMALAGRLNPLRHSPMAMAQNFDVMGTIRRNLKHYDTRRQQIVIEQLRFFERNNRRLPWDVILCVDQSGSMADSVIHSAVMAGILAGLPAFRVKIVVFDTNVVDLSGYVDDPLEVLMRVQLGGGTHIAQAVRYCSQLVENPHRTVFVLVSDFCEGAPPSELLREVAKLAEARVKTLGLAALDGQAHPAYDRQMAERLAACGMEIAALTPQRLAHWLVKVIS
ncbi:VWA domain-containing protein [Herbaspirillum huttiense F1]|jgi:VWA domain containing CoxE-like protein.|uniref:VWA domain-containing protein n=1 Tax=Herbaspirillum huttiense subsp. lycopersici TaxID=3074428 RepID=A0ABU2EFN8_9BURK|nr:MULTISPECIES: VWA domain-containing protein [Herbaspirillum]MBP1313254.1 Mg-chelatase subunit ChlD [Herbaspirillum sp. 1130]MDR6738490.1 Mg-chelatase subunit ChlD [Herbaspirillum sp. 1173]MDR9846592.1 VWA domain-containing protein [Herbaspirillum huttiense SE1]MDT0356033.1 VWA domain-containing protein [Herbaspirillum huttiense F1]